MQKPDLWKIVLTFLFPNHPTYTSSDWENYLERHLLPEIDLETRRFYGETTSAEALHPGLDYANKGHRRRLEAFYWHRQLFTVFDDLRLNSNEIKELCAWKGTLSDKNNFERIQNVHIRETTWDGVRQYRKKRPSAHVLLEKRPSQRGGSATPTLASELGIDEGSAAEDEDHRVLQKRDENAVDEAGGELQHNHGAGLNQRVMEAEWERWMIEALERGNSPSLPEVSHLQTLRDFASVNNDTQAQILRSMTTNAPPYSSSLSPSRTAGEQPQMDSSSNGVHDETHATRILRSAPLRPTPSSEQSHQIFNPAVVYPSDSRLSTRPLPLSSIESRPLHASSSTLSQVLDGSNAPRGTFWGRDAPDIFDDHSSSRITSLRDSPSQPARYTPFYPSARVVSASTSGLGPAASSAAPYPSVPS